MPLLGSDNNLTVTVSTQADTSGITEVENSLQAFQDAATVSISKLTGAVDDADGSIRSIRDAAAGAVGPITVIGENGEQAFIDTGKAADDANGKISGLWKAVAGGQIAYNAVYAAVNFFTTSVGDAISRVDTLNNSSKVFGNLGFNANDVKTAMDAVDNSIKGLPTSLDQAVSGMQSLALQNGNILVAQKEFTAMNDAVLSSGHSTDDLNNAIEQITQLDMGGPLDAQTWNSLRQSGLEPAMSAMAKMKGESLAQLKDEFGNGTLTVQDFMNMLQTLDTQGTGNMASLSKQAKDMTGGIGTGMANAKTAMVRGMADIIQAIGTANISGAIKVIGTAFEDALKSVSTAINDFKTFFDIMSQHEGMLRNIAIVITSLLLPAIIQFGVRSVIAIGLYIAQLAIAAASTIAASIEMAASWLLALGPIGLIAAAVIGLVALIIANWSTVKQWLSAFWGWLKSAASDAWGFITNNFSSAIDSVVSFFAGLPGRILGALGNAANWLYQTGRDVISGLTHGIEDAIGGIGSAIGRVGGDVSGAVKNALHSIHVPGFAVGTSNYAGGYAMVGENGPEMMYVPQGASIYTNTQSQAMQRQQQQGNTYTFTGNIILGDSSAVTTFFSQLNNDGLLAAKGLTVRQGA